MQALSPVIDLTWKRTETYGAPIYYLDSEQGYKVGMINSVQFYQLGPDRFQACYTDGYKLELIGFFKTPQEAIEACEQCMLTGVLPKVRNYQRKCYYGCHFIDKRVCIRI